MAVKSTFIGEKYSCTKSSHFSLYSTIWDVITVHLVQVSFPVTAQRDGVQICLRVFDGSSDDTRLWG